MDTLYSLCSVPPSPSLPFSLKTRVHFIYLDFLPGPIGTGVFYTTSQDTGSVFLWISFIYITF